MMVEITERISFYNKAGKKMLINTSSINMIEPDGEFTKIWLVEHFNNRFTCPLSVMESYEEIKKAVGLLSFGSDAEFYFTSK